MNAMPLRKSSSTAVPFTAIASRNPAISCTGKKRIVSLNLTYLKELNSKAFNKTSRGNTMKGKIMLTVLILTAALALFVAAQDKTDAKFLDLRMRRFQEVELRVITSAEANQVNTSGVRYVPFPSWAGKLRIEMLGGVTQEIDLKNVLKMTVSDR
jgi:hypothetical protein